MKRTIVGLSLGLVAGLIDLIPMFIQKLSWDANLSALSMWIIIGFFISNTDFKINRVAKIVMVGVLPDNSKGKWNPFIKGSIISLLMLIPAAFIIGWKEPASLIPIIAMTTILGGILGFCIAKANRWLKIY
jgi:hypothetical protein